MLPYIREVKILNDKAELYEKFVSVKLLVIIIIYFKLHIF